MSKLTLNRLSNVSLWLDYVWEIKHKVNSANNSTFELSWPFDVNKAKSITVFWPTQYVWAPRAKWGEPIASALAYHVKVERKDIEQPYTGIVLAEVLINEKMSKIIFQTSDDTAMDFEAYKCSSVYFIYQHRESGYGCDNVYPAGYIPYEPNIYDWLPHLRKLKDKNNYCYDVYGRFSLDIATEVRSGAINLLNSSNKFSFEGGGKIQRYSRSLKEITRSKICLDLPGNGPYCFRLVDYLAVGSCIVSFPHKALFPKPLVPWEHIVYVKDDLSDLVSVCEYLLDNPDVIESMANKSRDYFDKYLHARQLGAYYVGKIIEHLY